MDLAAVQNVVNAALAQQAAVHQQAITDAAADAAAALAQANIANAAALQQALAGLPPAGGAVGGAAGGAAGGVAGGAAGGAGAAPAFALTPGLANPGQPWNYQTSEGIKIFTFASTKLQDVPYNGDVKGIKMFLIALGKRGEAYGWDTELFTISNQAAGGAAMDKNLLKQYGVLTLANVQAHATVYIGGQTRAAQASVQLLNCITASIGSDLMMKLVSRQDEFTLNDVMDGTCMLYVLITLVVIQTRATISVIRLQLKALPALLKTHKSNIINFNTDVDDKITSLRAMDEGCEDLLSSMFAAYQTASDKEFRDYIRDMEIRWENNEIVDLSVEQLMKSAESRYKVMVEKDLWAKPSREEADLMALAASIAAKKDEADKSNGGSGKDRSRTKGPRSNEGEWAWKDIAPVGNQPREKTFKNKVYVACKHHKNTQWVLKEGHLKGCRNDPNFVKDVDEIMKKSDDEAEKKAAPSKKTLQFAHALMHAMETEENGGLDGQDE